MDIPASTYRLQINPRFNFAQVKKILPYLKKLGISWLYLSPIMQANPGSLHGYDVTNLNQINNELGGAGGFFDLCQALSNLEIGLLVDFVPNHMAASEHNPWWQDVVQQGCSSQHAYLFDIFGNLSDVKKLSYRRFFDINELVCLRMEDPKAFSATHQLILQLIRNKQINGLRLDHIDGLKDPYGYLSLLQKEINQPSYIVAEKILARNEKLPTSWKISGTTGYDFINELNQIFVNSSGLKQLQHFYDLMLDSKVTIGDLRYINNKIVIEKLFKVEFDNLVKQLQDIATSERSFAPLRMTSMEDRMTEIEKLLLEFCAVIPAYRTYIQNYTLSPADKKIIDAMFTVIHQQSIKPEYLHFLKQAFNFTTTNETDSWLDWVKKWQVFTGPMIAKGYEDTTCYQFNLLLSLTEVGSEPLYFNAETVGDLNAFHKYNQYKQLHYPQSLNASSTHDTKRSEDIRARLNVLTEIPEEWQQAVTRWRDWNQSHKIVKNGQTMPDINDEIMLYQTLLGAWPLHTTEIPQFKKHMHTFLTKAIREGKVHSSWQNPNENYEQAILSFCDSILTESEENKFLTDFINLQQKLAYFGMLNSLTQLILKIFSPGIPDLYQGNELWEFDLVDPDNRHPVDFTLREELLNSLQATRPEDSAWLLKKLLDSWPDGQIKLYLTYKILNFRTAHAKLFSKADYIPLTISGSRADNVVTFIRHHANKWILVAVPRWCSQLCVINKPPLADNWEDTQILLPASAPKRWRSLLTNEEIICNQELGLNFHLAAKLFNQFPMGVYINI